MSDTGVNEKPDITRRLRKRMADDNDDTCLTVDDMFMMQEAHQEIVRLRDALQEVTAISRRLGIAGDSDETYDAILRFTHAVFGAEP